jgi:hypothetical protein
MGQAAGQDAARLAPGAAGWAVPAINAAAYVPIAVGAWHHPQELNLASYCAWLMLCSLVAYSSLAQGFAGWRMPLAFAAGNAAVIAMAVSHGGATFNLGLAETTVLYGLLATVSTWATVGHVTGKWSPRILFLGSVGRLPAVSVNMRCCLAIGPL